MDGASYGRAFRDMAIGLIIFGIVLGIVIVGLGWGGWEIISHLRWE